MSKNDQIFLQAHFDNWLGERAVGLDKSISPFLYYCVEQFTKSFNLADSEMLSGITDGGNDGGVDAIYFFADGVLVSEEGRLRKNRVKTVELVLINVKDSERGFGLNEVNKLHHFVDDYLDLSQDADMSPKYNRRVLRAMDRFKRGYRRLAPSFPTVSIDFYYITKIDEGAPHPNVEKAAAGVCETAKEHFRQARCRFHFVNLQSLLQQVRVEPPSSRLLEWDDVMQADEGYLGLVNLSRFCEFLDDQRRDPSQRIFDANVRGWQQETPVNKEIRDSLQNNRATNFWLLNNGITVLASAAQTEGKNRLRVKDPQIVNGLQTSRVVYRYFRDDNHKHDERQVLVRIIVTKNEQTYAEIVKATNRQNVIPQASFQAHEPIQFKIEELYKRYGLFYDRRKGHHKDLGRPVGKIIPMTEVLQAVLATLLVRPDDARARPGNYWKKGVVDQIFGEDKPLMMYLSAILLSRRVAEYLSNVDGLTRGHITNLKYYVLTTLSCRLLGTLEPTAEALAELDPSEADGGALEEAYELVWRLYEAEGADDTAAKGSDLLAKLKAELGRILEQGAEAP